MPEKREPWADNPARIYTPGEVVIERQRASGGGAGGGGGGAVIVGYAAVWYDGTPATEFKLSGWLTERVRRGAFRRAIQGEDDVMGLFNHKSELVLGRASAGTLRLWEDDRGLRYRIEAPETTTGQDVIELLRRRDVTGSSFSFKPLREEWREEEGRSIVELLEVQTYDVGPVTFPAYVGTEAELASWRARRDAAAGRGDDVARRLEAYRRRAATMPQSPDGA